MGVIEDTRNRVRWTYARARYVARTEGVGALARTTAAKFGLGQIERPSALLPRQPMAGDTSDCQWPASVLMLGSPTTAESALLDQDMSVFRSSVHAPDRQQLVSVLYVVGVANWPAGEALAEARRLRQKLILELQPDDPADALPQCDLILLAQPRDLPATTVPVRLLPGDGPGLAQLLEEAAP